MDDTDAQARAVWPELEAIAQPARERRRLPPAQRSDIIARLCAVTPLSVKELSQLLDRSEAYIGDAIRPLVNEGRLTFLFPDQPRHPKQRYLAAKAETNGHALESLPGEARVVERPAEPAVSSPSAATVTAAPAPQPAAVVRTPSPVQRPTDATPPVGPMRVPAALPNQWTNAFVVVVTGIVLSQMGLRLWLLIAAIVSIGLALLHVVVHSEQYESFRSLQAITGRRPISFVLLKAGVALVEIVVVYFVASAIA